MYPVDVVGAPPGGADPEIVIQFRRRLAVGYEGWFGAVGVIRPGQTHVNDLDPAQVTRAQ